MNMTPRSGPNRPTGYTSGEGAALIAPLCDIQPEQAKAWFVVAADTFGVLIASGTNILDRLDRARLLAAALAAELAAIDAERDRDA